MRILIIDDSDWKINDIISCLKEDQVNVDVAKGACDGLGAIYKNKKNPYDLIFLDRQMPLYADEYNIEVDAGDFILEELKRIKCNIPVCTVSSEAWDTTSQNVIYNLRYDVSVYLEPKIQEVLNLIKVRKETQ